MAPLARVGKPAEVAWMILYLVSDAASFVTGQIMRPNGGTAMPWWSAASTCPGVDAARRRGAEPGPAPARGRVTGAQPGRTSAAMVERIPLTNEPESSVE